MPPKDPVVIHDAATTFEAQLVLDDLKAAGIEALAEATVPQNGEAARQQILVDRADEEKARKLVESYQPDVDEDAEPEKTLECHNCGQFVDAEAISCPVCGKPLIKADAPPVIKEVDSPFAHPPAPSKAGDTLLMGGVIVMVGLAVAGMAAAIVGLVLR